MCFRLVGVCDCVAVCVVWVRVLREGVGDKVRRGMGDSSVLLLFSAIGTYTCYIPNLLREFAIWKHNQCKMVYVKDTYDAFHLLTAPSAILSIVYYYIYYTPHHTIPIERFWCEIFGFDTAACTEQQLQFNIIIYANHGKLYSRFCRCLGRCIAWRIILNCARSASQTQKIHSH